MTKQEAGRLGGLALRDKVDPVYFRWLGRRGGRKFKMNILLRLAATADDEERRAGYVEWAFEKYGDVADAGRGQRVMLGVFAPGCGDLGGKGKRKPRKKVAR